MLEAFVYLTICVIVYLSLIYKKTKSRAIISYISLGSSIIFTAAAIIFFMFNSDLGPLVIMYALVFLLLFLGIGKSTPIETWEKIYKECKREFFINELDNGTYLSNFLFIQRKVLGYTKEIIYAALIATVFIAIWIFIKKSFF